MNESINHDLSHLEKRIIPLLQDAAKAPIIRYNNIMNTYFDDEFLIKAGVAAGVGGTLIKASSFSHVAIEPISAGLPAVSSIAETGTLALPEISSSAGIIADGGIEVIGAEMVNAGVAAGSEAAAATTGSSLVTSTVSGTVAAGGSALSVYLPMITAAIGGFMAGKAIGNVVLDKLIMPTKGKKELEKLKEDVIKLKSYCKSMDAQLKLSLAQLKGAYSKLEIAAYKLADLEYTKKNENVKRIENRKKEINAMYADVAKLRIVVNAILVNLNKIA